MKDLTDEEILAMWRRGELVVRTGRILHGDATAEAFGHASVAATKKSYAPDPKPTQAKKKRGQ